MGLNINKIINLYKTKLMTQEDVAEKSSISVRTLSFILNGKSDPSLSTLEKIAEALEVPVAYFFDDKQEKGKDIISNNNGHAINGNHNNVKVIRMQAQNNEIEHLKREIEGLKREIEEFKALIDAKDKIIEMLEKQNK